jgi:hypothetical protein
MNSIGTNLQNKPSPFRFDLAPQGEADVTWDQVSVVDGNKHENDGWGADGFSFGDVVDVLNPLQHIPVVSSIYRAVTSDEIAAAPRAIGGALFGGPVGLIVAISNQVVEAENGLDIPGTVLAMLSSGDGVSPKAVVPGQVDRAASAVSQSLAWAKPAQKFAANAQLPQTSAALLQPPNLASGLFAGEDRQVSPTVTRLHAPSIQAFGATQTLQSAPVGALDRLIARSQASAATNVDTNTSLANVGQPTGGPSVPTDPQKIRQWILRALGKYETMPKGQTYLEGRHP